jgi:hypothetical protein
MWLMRTTSLPRWPQNSQRQSSVRTGRAPGGHALAHVARGVSPVNCSSGFRRSLLGRVLCRDSWWAKRFNDEEQLARAAHRYQGRSRINDAFML